MWSTQSPSAPSIEKGKRLATIYGCFNSCHGKNMEGCELYDEPGIAVGGRTVGMMTDVGTTRFPSLTDEEVEAMRRYLGELYRS